MATHNSVTKNQKTNIIVITGNDETLQNLLSIIQNSHSCGELDDITRHVVSVLKSYVMMSATKSYLLGH